MAPVQASACCDELVHWSTTGESTTGVSINSMAGQSSRWALPCILVFFSFFVLSVFDKMTRDISKMLQSCSPLVTILYQVELPGNVRQFMV